MKAQCWADSMDIVDGSATSVCFNCHEPLNKACACSPLTCVAHAHCAHETEKKLCCTRRSVMMVTNSIPIWEKASSWEHIGQLSAGDLVLVDGFLTEEQGYLMKPVVGGGCVQADFLRAASNADGTPYQTKPKTQKITSRAWMAIQPTPRAAKIAPRLKDVCLIDCFQGLGVKAPYTHDGPFWAQEDGNELLLPFGKELTPVPLSNLKLL